MVYSSSLNDILGPLVLDASVLVNLHACKFGDQILAAIPNSIVISRIVARELQHETSRRTGGDGFLHSLVSRSIVEVVDLTDDEYKIFRTLTLSSPSLDDGEAATIALAIERELTPVIDERKGRARAKALRNGREPGWSLDLFRHPSVTARLGEDLSVEALHLALRDGRMRIPLQSAPGIIALLGLERSRDCTCLPGYRDRFGRDKPA